jgi:hypothetical protein
MGGIYLRFKKFYIYKLKITVFFPVHETNFLTFSLDNLCRQCLYSLKIFFSQNPIRFYITRHWLCVSCSCSLYQRPHRPRWPPLSGPLCPWLDPRLQILMFNRTPTNWPMYVSVGKLIKKTDEKLAT